MHKDESLPLGLCISKEVEFVCYVKVSTRWDERRTGCLIEPF